MGRRRPRIHPRSPRRPGIPLGDESASRIDALGESLLSHELRDRPLTLWDARLIDGRDGRPKEHAIVRVAGDRITAVEQVDGRPVPGDAIDVGGRTLLPGLIDAHTHVISDTERSPGFGPPPELHGEEPRPDALRWFVLAKAARAWLAAGITTVRDVGSPDDEAITLREAIRLGLIDGPRIVSCGRIVSATAPGARIFGTMYDEADGPWEMRRAVRRQLRRGADYIKVMATGARSVVREDPEPAQLTAEEIDALVDEAHRLGLRVAAHAEGLEGARLAIAAGVDTLEHGLSLHREPALLDRMVEQGMVLVPTLSTFHDLAERFATDYAPSLVKRAQRQAEEAALTIRAARAAGVTLAMGYDSGPPGASARELGRMVESGLPAAEAIVAATTGSARALGRKDIGAIEPGMLADLLIVGGDPLDDIGVLTDPSLIWLVIHGGIPVSPV